MLLYQLFETCRLQVLPRIFNYLYVLYHEPQSYSMYKTGQTYQTYHPTGFITSTETMAPYFLIMH